MGEVPLRAPGKFISPNPPGFHVGSPRSRLGLGFLGRSHSSRWGRLVVRPNPAARRTAGLRLSRSH